MKKPLRDALFSLPALGATEGKPKNHKVIIYASNGWVWETYETDVVFGKYGPDIKCFGKVKGFEEELGYWIISEILMSGANIAWTEIKEAEASS